ncbi:MAG: metal-dependent hydrolase [Methanobacteriaceae archaeon]
MFSLLIALLVTAPFIPNLFYLSLAVIGASIVDLDHPLRNENLLLLALFGIILVLILYILQISISLGLILILLALIFFISTHRGFMHSIMGVTLIATLLTLFAYSAFELFTNFSVPITPSLAFISIFLGVMILNKQVVPFYVILTFLGIFLMSNAFFNLYYTFFAFFMGLMSHIILDLGTGRGVALLSPLSSKKFGKKMLTILILLWIVGLIWVYFKMFF